MGSSRTSASPRLQAIGLALPVTFLWSTSWVLAAGAQFLSLAYLPALTTSLLLSFTPFWARCWASCRGARGLAGGGGNRGGGGATATAVFV